ncbi:MAG: GH3 auxin-responsive promoter family protein [Desulfobacterales bacterium]
MSLTGWLIGWITRSSAARFETASRDPEGVQERKLLEILSKNADTEYGRRYGFGGIRSFEDYRKRVPIITYEDIKTDMERVVTGAPNIFTAEPPVMFAQTSGTTGDPKYVPVTSTCRGRENRDVMRTWTHHAKRDHPDIFDAKVVSLVSPAVEGHTPSGLPFGSTSGLMYKTMPAVVRRAYSIPYDIFEIEDYSAKYYAIMRIALEHDVRFLATANPSSILKLCEKANEHSEAIIADIHDGRLSEAFVVEPAIRSNIGKRLKPNPGRARELAGMRNRRNGRLTPSDYWPRLSLIGCWKGGTVGHYLDKFPSWFDPDETRPVPVRDWGYLSSEARASVPLSDQGSSGVLTIASNLFEFVPVDDLESRPDDPSLWSFTTVGDLEEGAAYYIFITTTGGLYRYDINDVIKVTGRYNRTPQIVFLRKGRGMTNITGEKVSVNQIISSIQLAAEGTGTVVDHFKAEADTAGSRYLFRVEFATTVSPETQRQFLQTLDSELKAGNIEYKSKRDSMRLKAPVLHVMKEGWYERGRRAQVESGMRAFQAKTQLLSAEKIVTQAVRADLEAIVQLDEQT